MKKILSIAALSLFLFGCSSTIPVNYIPSPMMKGSGKVDVGEFEYEPAKQGKVKPNQYQQASGSIGTMYISESANTLLAGALKKELIASGFDVSSDASVEISGNIQKFLYDWIGFVEVDFYLDVEYIVKKNKNIVYQDVIKTHKASPKNLVQDSEATKSAISENISTLLQNLRSKGII